jgi:hypothetical protein
VMNVLDLVGDHGERVQVMTRRHGFTFASCANSPSSTDRAF